MDFEPSVCVKGRGVSTITLVSQTTVDSIRSAGLGELSTQLTTGFINTQVYNLICFFDFLPVTPRQTCFSERRVTLLSYFAIVCFPWLGSKLKNA